MGASMDSQDKEPSSNTETLFVAKQQLRILTQGQMSETYFENQGGLHSKSSIDNGVEEKAKTQTKRPLFNDLVYCACRPNANPAKKTLDLINQNADLAQQFARVLRSLSLARSGAQVAASSQSDIEERSNDKFELRIKQDRLNTKQAYILLKLKSDLPNTEQGLYLHLLRDNQFFVLHFPELFDNKTQVVIDKSSQIYALLCHAETQIFIQQN